ncbi:MAG: proton-conducting transporter membrane subunit [Gammaproteobacteria bacterium]|nr:proton-conducting transporter membrane subunit [Gammaproteobacteria bacterium]
MAEQWIWLVPLLPTLASAWILLGMLFGFNRGERGERQTALVIQTASLLSLLLLLALMFNAVPRQQLPGLIDITTWFSTGDYQIKLNFLLDGLALGLSLVVALVSLLSIRFSVNYMHREAGFQRFFAILGLFNGAMLLIVLAGNAMLTFIGWELAGVSSYLLIAYAYDRPNATENATRAFVTNRIGDTGFILAITFSFILLGNVDWPSINAGNENKAGFSLVIIMIGFLMAAMAKSALVPFSSWITRALEGPTPSSAVFYGSLMVHSGVYLIIRLQPLFEQSPFMMFILILIGALTAIYGFLGGLVQTDVKSSLMFSTTGQVGLMFISCGLGLFEIAAWHLGLHAIWRAYHFLNAPAMLHLMHKPARPVPAWLQNRKWLYLASVQRFWLDNLANAMLVRPALNMAHDVQRFDEQIVVRAVGLPNSVGAISSLAQWEEYKDDNTGKLIGDSGAIGRGRGALGNLMEWLASVFSWFEEHLVLKGGDEGVISLIQHAGHYLNRLEKLLSQPRYLFLMIILTFAVIL